MTRNHPQLNTGEATFELLNVIAADDPITCAAKISIILMLEKI